MNKFMNLEEIRHNDFRKIFDELDTLYRLSQGAFLNLYYKYWQKNFRIPNITRQWEYPWAIMNSQIKRGQRVLDAGCGNSPLLLYLFRRNCLCYGIDNKFYYEIHPPSSWNVKMRPLVVLSKIYPLYFLFNPNRMEGLSDPGKALGLRINYIKGSLSEQPFEDNIFDRIFCISTLEHLNKEDIFKAAYEFKRILKKEGLLIVTVDCLENGLLWKEFIRLSGLDLYGESDFDSLPKEKHHHNVVGFVLKK
jgi:ubiquinone/menaquinone biosynthesis C-methylase UbiE